MYTSKLQTESELLEKLWTGLANTFGRSAKIDFIYNSLLHMIRSQHKNFLKTDYYIRGPDFPLSINSINFRRREKGRGPHRELQQCCDNPTANLLYSSFGTGIRQTIRKILMMNHTYQNLLKCTRKSKQIRASLTNKLFPK